MYRDYIEQVKLTEEAGRNAIISLEGSLGVAERSWPFRHKANNEVQ
jgi:hypothetical protein